MESFTATPDAFDPAPEPPRPRWAARAAGALWEWMRTASVAVLCFLLVRAILVEAFKIPSGSMEGTLLAGDFLLVNKLVYGAEMPLTGTRLPALRAPGRGDVVVFQWPQDPHKNFVKRIVGVAGDTLAMRDGLLYRNGLPVIEPYVRRESPESDPSAEEFRWQRDHLVRRAVAATGYHPSRNNWGPLVVPPGRYFVLGDNRDNSLDSRYWGFVADTLVRGRPILVYFSLAPDSTAPLQWLTRVRWRRLGERVE